MVRTVLALAGAALLAACASGDRVGPEPEAAPPPTTATAPLANRNANPTVGGATMLPSRDLVTNAAAAPTLSTLVAAVRAADLATTLAGPGPFTVFAPTDEAFGRLAPGIVDTLMKPENRPALQKLLRYHVVAGTVGSADLLARIAAGGGTATLVTLEGEPLTATLTSNIVTLTDVNGNRSYVETADVRQANGMVHVVNGVMVPKL